MQVTQNRPALFTSVWHQKKWCQTGYDNVNPTHIAVPDSATHGTQFNFPQKSDYGARGLSVRVPETVRDALAPRSRPSVPPSGSKRRGTWGRCVDCRAQPSFRLQTRRKKQQCHGTDLTSRQKRKCAKMEKNDSSATSICLETNTRCTLWDADVTTDPKTCKSIFSQIALGPATVYSPELNSSAGATFNRDAGGCDAQFKFLRGHSGS